MLQFSLYKYTAPEIAQTYKSHHSAPVIFSVLHIYEITDRHCRGKKTQSMQSNISHLQEPTEAHQSLINVSTPLWRHIRFKLLFIEKQPFGESSYKTSSISHSELN